MYSNKRIQASYNAIIAFGLDGNRSTNVTAKMMPHTTSNTKPTPEKNLRNRKRFKIFSLNIDKIIQFSFDNCKIKMNAYNFQEYEDDIGRKKWKKNQFQGVGLIALSKS